MMQKPSVITEEEITLQYPDHDFLESQDPGEENITHCMDAKKKSYLKDSEIWS